MFSLQPFTNKIIGIFFFNSKICVVVFSDKLLLTKKKNKYMINNLCHYACTMIVPCFGLSACLQTVSSTSWCFHNSWENGYQEYLHVYGLSTCILLSTCQPKSRQLVYDSMQERSPIAAVLLVDSWASCCTTVDAETPVVSTS